MSVEANNIDNNNILIVDNVVDNQLFVKESISSFNKTVTFDITESGLIAIEMIVNNNYDLIIINFHLPEVNGLDALIQIRNLKDARKKLIPVIGVTNGIKMFGACEKYDINKCVSFPIEEKSFVEYVVDIIISSREIVNKNHSIDESTKYIEGLLSTLNLKHTNLKMLVSTSGGNSKMLKKIIDICLSKLPTQIESFEDSISRRDIKNIFIVTHTLKTTYNYLGLNDLRDVTIKIEQSARKEVLLDDIDILKDNIVKTTKESIDELSIVSKIL